MDKSEKSEQTTKTLAERASSIQRISVELEKNLKIDALVSAPDSTDLSLPLVRVQTLIPDAQTVCSILFPNTEIKDKMTYSDPNAISFELDGEKSISTSLGNISAFTPSGEFVRQLYGLEWILNDETLQHPDLNFASRDEVIRQTLNTLSEVGLKNVQCTKAYTLSVDRLQSASGHLASQSNLAEDIKQRRMAMHEPIKLLAADLSLRYPGFAIIRFEGGKAVVETLYHIEDRSPTSSHGKLLGGIYELLCTISEGIDVFVREKAFSRFAKETQAISKAVGIADQTAWQKCQAVYHELAPTSVKKLITGSGKADKNAVAIALRQYVGETEYKTDDESDAVAVGIAWLIQNGYLDGQEIPAYKEQ